MSLTHPTSTPLSFPLSNSFVILNPDTNFYFPSTYFSTWLNAYDKLNVPPHLMLQYPLLHQSLPPPSNICLLFFPSQENFWFSDLSNQLNFRNSWVHSKLPNHDLRWHASTSHISYLYTPISSTLKVTADIHHAPPHKFDLITLVPYLSLFINPLYPFQYHTILNYHMRCDI